MEKYQTNLPMSKLPIFFAFANDKEVYALHKRLNLADEQNEISKVLKARNIASELLMPFNKADFLRIFQEKGKEFQIFHYGGHGGKDTLFFENFEDNQSVNAEYLVNYLASFSLKLVFMNACETIEIAEKFAEKGILAIGTKGKIDDATAIDFARTFYGHLATGDTVLQAFERAKNAQKLTENRSKSPNDWHLLGKNTDWKLSQKTEYIFNESLSKRLIEAIVPHSKTAENFLAKAQTLPNWEKNKGASDKAKEVLAYSFVGILGVQLSKLMAIGKEDFTEAKARKYVDKCLFIAEITLDLINFALISKLWDKRKKQNFSLNENQTQLLKGFFENSFEADLMPKLEILKEIYQIFESQKLPLPFAEWEVLKECLASQTTLNQTCQKLQKIQTHFENLTFDEYLCEESENLLTDFLANFTFLVKYKMASIKQIAYKHARNSQPNFVHHYTALGIDSKAQKDAEKHKLSTETVATDAVLLYKGTDYQEHINLFPFVIDYNALMFENGSKICFFTAVDFEGRIEYRFLEDNTEIEIEFADIQGKETDLSEIVGNREKARILNLDNVFLQFQEAKKTILGDQVSETISFDNIFEE